MNDGYLNRMISQGEKILLVKRQHWIKLVQAVVVELILVLIIVAAVLIVQATLLPDPRVSLGYFLVLLPLISLLGKVLQWTNHKFVITTRRVIEMYGVFSKNVHDSSLEKVNDVNMEQSFWGRLLNYGDIYVITGSDVGVDELDMIGEPVRFKNTMLEAKQRLTHSDDFVTASPARDIPALIAELDRLRRQGVLTETEFQEKKRELLEEL